MENVGQAISNITFYEFDSIQEDSEITYYTFKVCGTTYPDGSIYS